MELSNQTKGILCSLFGILILCPDTLCLRFLGEISANTMIFYKYLIFGCTFLFAYILKERHNVFIAFHTLGKVGFAAGVFFGIACLAITYAFINTAIANVVVINAANPIFSAFFSWIILKEGIPLRTAITAAVSFAAIILIFYEQLGSGSSSDANTFGLIASLVTAVTQGLFFVLIRWAIMVGDNPDMVPCNAIAGFLVVIISLCVGQGEGLNDITGRQLGIIFLESVVILPIAFTLLTLGPSYISAPETALFSLVETVVAPFLIWLAGFEAPPISAIYGGIILLIALAINSYLAMREEESAHQKDPNTETSTDTLEKGKYDPVPPSSKTMDELDDANTLPNDRGDSESPSIACVPSVELCTTVSAHDDISVNV